MMLSQTLESHLQSLSLSEPEMDELFDKILNPKTTIDEKHVASNAIIQIMLQQYHLSDPAAHKFLLVIFYELLDQDEESLHLHAFDILINLSLRIVGCSSLYVYDPNQKDRLKVEVVLQDVYEKLLEMIELLAKKECKSAAVWSHALRCLLMFVVDEDGICQQRAEKINGSLIANFLQYSPNLSDYTIQFLTQILINNLYLTSSTTLATPNTNQSASRETVKLRIEKEKFLGVGFIVDLFLSVRSDQARNAIFRVFFDFCVIGFAKYRKVDEESITRAVNLLIDASFPVKLAQFFYYTPVGSVDNLIKVILQHKSLQTAEIKDETLKNLSVVVTAVLLGLEKWAKSWWSVDKRYQKIVTMDIKEQHKIIHYLLHSEESSRRHHGITLLFQIFREISAPSDNSPPAALNKKKQALLEHVLDSLLGSKNWQIRMGYLTLVKMMSAHLRCLSSDSIEAINTGLRQMVKKNESHSLVLMKMLDIIFELVTEAKDTSHGAHSYQHSNRKPHPQSSACTTPYTEFLNSRLHALNEHLSKLDPAILVHLFNMLPPEVWCSEGRVTSLCLLLGWCRIKMEEITELLSATTLSSSTSADSRSGEADSIAAKNILIEKLNMELRNVVSSLNNILNRTNNESNKTESEEVICYIRLFMEEYKRWSSKLFGNAPVARSPLVSASIAPSDVQSPSTGHSVTTKQTHQSSRLRIPPSPSSRLQGHLYHPKVQQLRSANPSTPSNKNNQTPSQSPLAPKYLNPTPFDSPGVSCPSTPNTHPIRSPVVTTDVSSSLDLSPIPKFMKPPTSEIKPSDGRHGESKHRNAPIIRKRVMGGRLNVGNVAGGMPNLPIGKNDK
ncbi:hypothetical protein BKA69DRAFT_1174863 [Paraphysoderma sedebokerense]|nr:hypothetical protein BKA69DRAFT_1174863 [Paraphysoderma sedebokerense]